MGGTYGSSDSSRIVRTSPGAGTGETIYETADGRRWRTIFHDPPSGGTTGQTIGYVDGDRMRIVR